MTRSWALVLAGISAAWPAGAEPLRLRGDAFFAAETPAGLLVLEGEGKSRKWLHAEALVWVGAGDTASDRADDRSGSGDALIVAIRLRDPGGRGELRLGRLIVATGAIRPLHIDGTAVRARSPWGLDVEAFGGLPVVPGFGVDAYDWLAGTRISYRASERITAGVSYFHERDAGALADEEVGIDLAARPARWLDIAARAAYDTVDPGLADAHLSAAARRGPWRIELFASRRSPSRLLPATSLFSALGDIASDELGLAARWRAAPRLDVWASAAIRRADGDGDGGAEADTSTRAILRLDDRGMGALGLQLRRRGNHNGQTSGLDSAWTGVRGTLRLPVSSSITASAELELVIPDDAHGRGDLWPWGLVACSWRGQTWQAAAAIEAHASPESERAMTALVRLTRHWRMQ